MASLSSKLDARGIASLLLLALAVTSWTSIASAQTDKGKVLVADLFGFNQVGAEGDNNATGTAKFTYYKGDRLFEYEFTVTNLADQEAPTGTHIHDGEAGTSGAVVIFFDSSKWKLVSNAPIQKFSLKGAFKRVDRRVAFNGENLQDVIQGIYKDPLSYYVNFHTTNFGGGAVRGQLYKP